MKALFLPLCASTAAVCLAGTAAAQVVPVTLPTAELLEVRFCPADVAHPYPLDSLRGVQGLLLQNVAVINHGAPLSLEAVEIELLRAGEAIDSRLITGAALDNAISGAQAAKAQGLFEMFAFQVCDGALINGASLGDDTTLETGEALVVMQQPFAWKGTRDEIRVSARGLRGVEPVAGRGTIRLDATTSQTTFRFPLRSGTWLVAAGASFHTTHRWAVPEEFALDIIRLGPDLKSHSGTGEAHTDFHAYGAEVVAAADGTVIEVITGGQEGPPMLRRPDETMEVYYGRVGVQQAENMAGGLPGIIGEGVIIDHGNSEYSVYAHLIPGSAAVRKGQTVKAGDTIGRLGSSGNSTEAHLHFQVCDAPSALSCAGIVPTFVDLEIANTDGPRPLQSGDLVIIAPQQTTAD